MTTEITTDITGAVVDSLQDTADLRPREPARQLGAAHPFRHARFDHVLEPP
ncbi:hypothetical protein AB0D27_25140 [Streptomyces sp. NPDC048415]|jgi:hypothetical protein|uniref:hypothetical protein n=1 Tax=Streptomyces sp. NPDC048415 TaxID=3154822 RepID=UPI0034374764